MKVAIFSLGCPKNQVDADRFCRALIDDGHVTVPAPEEADAVIINTCGFIEAAKEEAIETILDVCALRAEHPALKVIVTGCLAERYREEVAAELPELDAVIGIGSNADLPAVLRRLQADAPRRGERAPPLTAFGPKTALPLYGPRVIGTPAHYAWLKIAEGCSNRCAYCAIPAIRGPLRSCPKEALLAEAAWLAAQGVRELVLVAQDVTAYGDDTGENRLLPLLKGLEQVEGIVWIRLLYAYPERVTPELLALMAQSQKILPYLDLPIQHCGEKILRSMRRRGGAAAVRKAVAMIRGTLPRATLRTSLIAGYPGETREDFEALCRFVEEARFERLGCFAYSPEEGTAAERLPGQVEPEERLRRAEVIMQTQAGVMARHQQAMVGRELTVICDGYDEGEGAFFCRGAADAPEVDVGVWLPKTAPLAPGGFYRVRVLAADGADLSAEYRETLF